ncbi:hedgehog receptor activity [Pseudocyphellaria aurata]|nr:hedgehog receptor activity [Pseudocyphellaria aurata]
MQYIQLLVSFSILHVVSIIFCGWPISGSPNPFNELLLRRQIYSITDGNDSPLIAQTHQNFPSTPEEEPTPDPQPGPPPNPEPFDVDQTPPGPLQPPDPQSRPPSPQPVGVPVPPILPIVPLPPLPAGPSPSPSPSPSPPQRARPVPRPVGGSLPAPQPLPGSLPSLPVPEPVSGFSRNSRRPITRPELILQGPDTSDYPDDDQIRQDIILAPEDGTVMYTEIGSLYPVRYFAENSRPQKYIYSDCFPYGYTWSNGRSGKWYQDFLDRLCRIVCEFASGKVYLVSKYPYGPESKCSVWSRIEFPALTANVLVDEIILVDFTNDGRTRPFWTIQDGKIGPNFGSRHKRDTTTTPCPIEDDMYDPYPNVRGGLSVDLTPILGAAAGWAAVDFVQHRRYDPEVNSKLDVSVINARGEQIGFLDGAVAVPGQEVIVRSQLPFAVRIIVPTSDNEPLHFTYGNLAWDTDDISRCTFDPWKSDVRTGRCKFDY